MSWSLTDQLPLLSAAVVGLFIAQRVYSSVTSDPDAAKVWAKLESVGLPSGGIFKWARAIAGSITATKQNAKEGYYKYSKFELPFALPSLWSGSAVIMLPPSSLPLLDRPRTELNTFRGLVDQIGLPYMFTDQDVFENTLHFDVIKKKLTNKDLIAKLAGITAEEFEYAYKHSWGTSNEWKEVKGWDACAAAIIPPAMAVLLGSPFGRNEVLLKSCGKYVDTLFMTTGILNCMPPPLRRVMGPILALRVKYLQGRIEKVLIPYVEERMRIWKATKEGQMNEDNESRIDFLQWMLPVCARAGPEQFNAKKVSGKLLALMTMFIFALGYMFGHSVFDLYGSEDKDEFLAALEEECERVSKEYAGLTTKKSIEALYRVDSCMRESMRISDAWVTGFPIDIISGKVDIGHGIKVPPGVRMAFPTQAIHLDPDNFENPQHYDALRFSRKWEESKASAEDIADGRELVTTLSKSFLAFGYGRHGCPGRWWSAQIIKQGIAYIVMNYDVEYLGGRPKDREALLTMMLPPTELKMRIRRKA